MCYDLQTYYGGNCGMTIKHKFFDESLPISRLKHNYEEDDILADRKIV